MRTFLLSLLLIFPSPITLIAFIYLATFFYLHELLKRVTNYNDQHLVPVRVTNKRYQQARNAYLRN